MKKKDNNKKKEALRSFFPANITRDSKNKAKPCKKKKSSTCGPRIRSGAEQDSTRKKTSAS